MKIDVKPELEKFIKNVGTRNGYWGNRIPASIMALFEIVETEKNIGVIVPYWIPVLQKGRGPRKGTKDYGLVKIIYKWMEKRGMFKSNTASGKISEAKGMTWYINKYGNQHFRSQVFVDVYESERKRTIGEIEKKYRFQIGKITTEII
jgi:hypothetical protein